MKVLLSAPPKDFTDLDDSSSSVGTRLSNLMNEFLEHFPETVPGASESIAESVASSDADSSNPQLHGATAKVGGGDLRASKVTFHPDFVNQFGSSVDSTRTNDSALSNLVEVNSVGTNDSDQSASLPTQLKPRARGWREESRISALPINIPSRQEGRDKMQAELNSGSSSDRNVVTPITPVTPGTCSVASYHCDLLSRSLKWAPYRIHGEVS